MENVEPSAPSSFSVVEKAWANFEEKKNVPNGLCT
jgi:hypothetical protein